MDAIGAQHLCRAIEQQEHWRRADAVREGRQELRDPHVADLVEFTGPSRRYVAQNGELFEKRLLDGAWVHV